MWFKCHGLFLLLVTPVETSAQIFNLLTYFLKAILETICAHTVQGQSKFWGRVYMHTYGLRFLWFPSQFPDTLVSKLHFLIPQSHKIWLLYLLELQLFNTMQTRRISMGKTLNIDFSQWCTDHQEWVDRCSFSDSWDMS